MSDVEDQRLDDEEVKIKKKKSKKQLLENGTSGGHEENGVNGMTPEEKERRREKRRSKSSQSLQKTERRKSKETLELNGVEKKKSSRHQSDDELEMTSENLNGSMSNPKLGEIKSVDPVFISSSMLLMQDQIDASKKEQEEMNKFIPNKEILLRWENLSKTVDIVIGGGFRKKKQVIKKEILTNVSGCVRPGEVMALMGPSGSGKTTLLNILGGRTTLGLSGDVTLNNEKMVKAMKRKIAYVMQQDIFFDHLTVRQQLTYTALLRFPRKMASKAKLAQVEKIISILGIAKCADSPIMFVSGGERKRVNIGTELLTNPTLLLLDEPTSGLDSTTSVQLMKTLRLLAVQGRTILTSIHQPSSQVFQSFDKLLLLADGKMIFFGPPTNVPTYFESLGYKSPPNYNPADFIMDLVNAEDNPREKLQAKFLEIGTSMIDLPPKGQPDQIKLADLAAQWPTSYLGQLQVLIRRNAKNSKSKLFTTLNFVQSIALAIITGLCWFRLKELDTTVTDRTGFIFFVMTFWPFQTLFSGILSFPAERAVLMKERSSGSYHLSAYFVAKALSEAPILLLLPTLFLIISYWVANMNPNFVNFLGFMFAELICVWAAESIGLFMGAAILDIQKALVIATISMLGLMLVGGFFVRGLPIFIYWARYLSIFTYAFNACLIVEFDDSRVFQCASDPLLPACATQTEVHGNEILDYLGVQGIDRNYGFNIGILLFILIFFRLLAYLSLRFLHTKHFRQ